MPSRVRASRAISSSPDAGGSRRSVSTDEILRGLPGQQVDGPQHRPDHEEARGRQRRHQEGGGDEQHDDEPLPGRVHRRLGHADRENAPVRGDPACQHLHLGGPSVAAQRHRAGHQDPTLDLARSLDRQEPSTAERRGPGEHGPVHAVHLRQRVTGNRADVPAAQGRGQVVATADQFLSEGGLELPGEREVEQGEAERERGGRTQHEDRRYPRPDRPRRQPHETHGPLMSGVADSGGEAAHPRRSGRRANRLGRVALVRLADMRLLVVEDEVKMAALLVRGPRARGLRGRRRPPTATRRCGPAPSTTTTRSCSTP